MSAVLESSSMELMNPDATLIVLGTCGNVIKRQIKQTLGNKANKLTKASQSNYHSFPVFISHSTPAAKV